MKGYKGFEADFSCRGFQYEVGKTYEIDGEIELCKRGFHFCEKMADVFDYYSRSDCRFAEIEAIGNIVTDGKKSVTNNIRIIKEISRSDAWQMSNTGRWNTGVWNTGNENTGNHNTGSRNTGGWNTGDRNTGNQNEGDWNTGDHNTGSRNTGGWNTGDHNTGGWNTGDRNTGDCNTGDRNTGDCNTGDWNTGPRNTGDWNTGPRNTGDCNTGGWNTGDHNTGDRNTGDWNTGNHNTGSRNTGDNNTGDYNTGDNNTGGWNTGDRNTGLCNTGDWNTTNHSTGCFCTKEQTILLFDAPSDMTYLEWRSSQACKILQGMPQDIDVPTWIHECEMTKKEKMENPTYKTTGGYLKIKKSNVNKQKWWDELSRKDKATVKAIPNFNAEKFYQCTGVKV